LLRRRHTNDFIEFALDALALVAAWYGTAWLRLLLNPFTAHQFTRTDLYASAPPVSVVLLLWVAIGVWMLAYRPRRHVRVGEEFIRLFESALLASMLNIVVVFFSRGFGAPMSRSFVLLSVPLNLAFLLLARYLAVFTIRFIDDRWPSPERIAILGTGGPAREAIERMRRSGLGFAVAGLILPEQAVAAAAAAGASGGSRASAGALSAAQSTQLPVLGASGSLAELINQKQLDRIIIVNGCATEEEIERCGAVTRRMGVVLSRTVDAPGGAVRLEFSRRFGIPLLELTPITFTRRQEMVKRIFDVISASLLLVLLGPLMLAIAALVKATSPGPMLYKASRVGRGGRYFRFLKFRSMYVGGVSRHQLRRVNEKGGHLFKLRNDPRITPLGRFLRCYSLDELPQLINVLRGDMSLVGPRPLPAEDLEADGQSRQFAAWSEQRSRVLPGITGLWQIRGRSDVPFEKMIDLDVAYIRDWSLTLDLRILLETPLVVMTGRGAY
jgi:exopolysaccharide biosynthesis polyprenyl glycosylphosphotransferase